MEKLKTKESEKKVKRKLMFISVGLTFFAIVIISLIATAIYGIKGGNTNNYDLSKIYSFSGDILNMSTVYSDIYLAIEKHDNIIYGVTLKDNELVSKKLLNENIEDNELNDFGVYIEDYNNDKAKDFVYINSKNEKGNIYKGYSIDRVGNIIDLDVGEIVVNSKKASLKITNTNGKYEYIPISFCYDGYKIPAEIGQYELVEKSEQKYKNISRKSKIAIEGKYNALPRKISIKKDISEYFKNVNNYLLQAENNQYIEIDLDGDKQKEVIASFVLEGTTYVSLFNSSANMITNLLSVTGNYEINELVEIADVDNDKVMEIIVINGKSLEVHKYNNGFYY